MTLDIDQPITPQTAHLHRVAERIAGELYNPQTLAYAGAVLGARAALEAVRDQDPEAITATTPTN